MAIENGHFELAAALLKAGADPNDRPAGFGALQMGTLVERLGGSYERAGATIVLVYFVGMITIWFAPETRGKPLPE